MKSPDAGHLFSGSAVGVLWSHLDRIEAAVRDGVPPGQTLHDALPKDKQAQLRDTVPAFKASLDAGFDVEQALVLTLIAECRCLMGGIRTLRILRGKDARTLESFRSLVARLRVFRPAR